MEKSDEGDYKCEGTNSNDRDYVIVQVDVQCTHLCLSHAHTHTRGLKKLDAPHHHSLSLSTRGVTGVGAGGGHHLRQWASGPGLSALDKYL